MKKLLVCLLCLAAAMPLIAEKTRRWRQSSFEEFERGTAENVTLRSDGKVMLAPKLEELYDAAASYLWDLAVAPDGTVYAAAGPEAKVLKLSPDGRKSVFFSTDAVEVHALTVDAAGAVYAATAPESRIYKIDPSGGYGVFYDPGASYVWDMVFGPDGALYVATGDEGKVHRVEPDGSGEVFFETGETHVRSLAVDPDGALIVGTDPGGLVMRIASGGGEARGFVLHQSPKKEMTAVAVAPDGTIFAAGAGARTAARPAVTTVRPAAQPANAAQGQNQATAQALQRPPAPAAVALQVQGGSAIVRIAPDGEPQEVWSHARDVVYALGFDSDGKLLAGTGDRGRLVRVESEHVFSVVTSVASSQITALARGGDGRVLAAASNVGRILGLGPGLETEGSLTSDVLDADVFARYGRADTASSGAVELALRSGNLNRPGRNWSRWTPSDQSVPAARYAQWRATLKFDGDASPTLDSVTLYYRPTNAAPRITALDTTPPNYEFPPVRRTSGPKTLTLPALGSQPPRRTAAAQSAPQTMVAQAGRYGIRWSAEDANEDELRAKVEIRGEGESTWIELADDLEQQRFSFDSTSFADGLYRLRVAVHDRESNPDDDARETARMSEPFLIDNTQPSIADLSAEIESGRIRVRFTAKDATTIIAEAEYSLDGADWEAVSPESGLFDSETATFDFFTAEAGEGEHTLAVRVRDERGNQAAAKTIVR